MKHIQKHNLYIILMAAVLIASGVLLLNADNTFQYPPGWKSIIDNDNLDVFIILSGISLLFSVFIKLPKLLYSLLIGIVVALLTFVLAEVVIHAYMMQSALLWLTAIYIFATLATFLITIFKR